MDRRGGLGSGIFFVVPLARLGVDAGNGKQLGKANLTRVETVGLVNQGDLRVSRFSELNVDTLLRFCVSLARGKEGAEKVCAYRVQGCAVDSQLDDLDGCEVAGLDLGVLGERHLGEADCAWVRTVRWAEDLDRRDHGVRHVGGTVVGPICAKA